MSVFPQMARLSGITLGFLFPKSCLGCGREGDFLCPKCRNSLTRIGSLICPKCGRPQMSGVVCPSCVAWDSAIDGIRSPFRFEGVMRQAVHQLKYRNLRALGTPLAGLMWDYLSANPVLGDVLVPVPLHPKRLRERGYNQSYLLAAELSKLSGLPVVDEAVVRQRYTPPQARTTSVEERRANIVGAFACREAASSRLKDRHVILVDDVATSAATLDACAAAVKEAGAAEVWGLVLAREI